MDFPTPSKQSLLTRNPTSSKHITVKNLQHQEDSPLKFPLVLPKLLCSYCQVTLIEFYYQTLLPHKEDIQIEVTIRDTRIFNLAEQKQIRVSIRGNQDSGFAISGLPSSLTSFKCPWVISIKVIASGLKFDAEIGELMIRPQFYYTNHKPGFTSLRITKFGGYKNALSQSTKDDSQDNKDFKIE